MKTLVIFLLFILLFVSQINTILDIDIWWNLKTGEYILKNLDVPHFDIFSYTLKDKPWLDHEWLSQALFYSVFLRFGWMGLNILKAFIISLCFFILLSVSELRYKRIGYAVFFILLSILAFGYRSTVRPEIFSYLFLCMFLYILESGRRIYLLPLLQIIWVNMHGYFILGPIVLSLYCIGTKERFKRYVPVFTLSILACFVNPYFYRGALYPLRIAADIFREQRFCMQNVQELMMPIKSAFGRYIFFWALAILASLTFVVNLKNVRVRHILLFGFSFLASYTAVRNLPIFIFTAMPLAAINLNEAGLTGGILERKRHLAALIFLTCGLIYFFLSDKYYIYTNQFLLRKTGSEFSRFFMPSGACDFLRSNNIKGPMFNTLDFGPYIGYRFYPERRIFIDTRTDLYKDDFYRLYRKAQNYPAEWRRIHKRYGFNIALLRHLFGGTERIIHYLYNNKRWVLVYYDEISCVFLRDIQENSEIIDRFRINFSRKKVKDSDMNLHVARFFEKIGETNMAEKVYVELSRKDPWSLEAGNNLAAIYINTARYKKGIDLIKKLLGLYPKSAQLYANLGTAYLYAGKKEQAMLLLEKSAGLDPYLRGVSYMLGIAYLDRGETDKAMRQFVKYSRLDPYNPEVHRILAGIYAQKGLLKNAESEYNEAAALEGSDEKGTF